jgi:hypothetical protein
MKYLNLYSLLILRLVKLRENLLVIPSQIVIIKMIIKMTVVIKMIAKMMIIIKTLIAMKNRIKIIKKRREISDVGIQ